MHACEEERTLVGLACLCVSLRQEDFVRPLVSLILQKVDERADLLMRLASS